MLIHREAHQTVQEQRNPALELLGQLPRVTLGAVSVPDTHGHQTPPGELRETLEIAAGDRDVCHRAGIFFLYTKHLPVILIAHTTIMKNKLTRASSYKRFKAAAPSLVSMSNALKSTPAPKALRSPFSNAPNDWSRFAAADANRRSPPHGVTSMRYSGADLWLLR